MFLPIFPIPVRTGLNTTCRYPLENGFTTELINPLLNPHIARLNGSMGSLNPDGRTMESLAELSGTRYAVELVAIGAVTCAGAAGAARLPRAAKRTFATTTFIGELIRFITAFMPIIPFACQAATLPVHALLEANDRDHSRDIHPH